ncbi:hypothetical protein KQX54_019842 [Cotesia glomerata]|uniref:Uncharacterized protein n=1 Tax=Cotesia glomerata TaxID=32391 RepID=A0AAV7J0R3_COTGL|nr:hypothetical protein KQX54_019842 [Cotesia glomerata]
MHINHLGAQLATTCSKASWEFGSRSMVPVSVFALLVHGALFPETIINTISICVCLLREGSYLRVWACRGERLRGMSEISQVRRDKWASLAQVQMSNKQRMQDQIRIAGLLEVMNPRLGSHQNRLESLMVR